MERALQLAAFGTGLTTPNPVVGAVVVRHGRIVGEGYHRRAGGAHAEIMALRAAGSNAQGADLYVTLEPCCHTGRTGPCTGAIADSGIKRVVFADKDPDPRVNGLGARTLRKFGIEVTSGVLRSAARNLNRAHYYFHTTGRPFVTLKMAQSIDGRIATVTGDSKWISGERARDYAHRLRAESGAVVVGMGTVKADNPSLTVRRVKGPNPYRIILSRSLAFPRKCELLSNNNDYRTIVVSSESAIQRFSRTQRGKGLIFWSVRLDKRGMLDIAEFLKKCASFGLKSILVEGGASVATSFLASNQVDRCVTIIAPVIIGEGTDAVGNLGTRHISQAIRLERKSIECLGTDIVVEGYPKR